MCKGGETEKYTLNISCIILVGGKGLRLRRDKAAQIINGESLLQRAVSQLSPFGGDIIIVTAKGQPISRLTSYPSLMVVADTYPGKGPLGGIHTGLAASNSPYNLVVACDMPFLNQALLHYMIQLVDSFDLVVPRLGEMVEPLHAIYSRNCLPIIDNMIKQGNLSVNRLLPLVKTRYVEAEEIDRFDPEHLSIFNINTKADLELAKQFISGDTDNDKH
jgi:molybdopterin-guanine dinucleotide biosynthesis protein A